MKEDLIENLKAQLSKKYRLEYFDLQIEKEIFNLLTVANIDELYEELIAKGPEHQDFIDERIPYWADLWHSAIGMAQYILSQKPIKPNQRVLEIGCGLGLPGIAAGKSGAEVILTDYLPEALEVAELVWRMNLNTEPNLQTLDWRNPNPVLKADVVLASDVAYEKRNFEPLLHAFRTLVKPEGRIIISEPGRALGKEFLSALKAHIITQKVIKVPYRGILTKVNVIELQMNC